MPGMVKEYLEQAHNLDLESFVAKNPVPFLNITVEIYRF